MKECAVIAIAENGFEVLFVTFEKDGPVWSDLTEGGLIPTEVAEDLGINLQEYAGKVVVWTGSGTYDEDEGTSYQGTHHVITTRELVKLGIGIEG